MNAQDIERAGELVRERRALMTQVESIESELSRPADMTRRKFTCGTEYDESRMHGNRHLFSEVSFRIHQDLSSRNRALVDAYLDHLRLQVDDVEAKLRELGVEL